MKVLFQSRVDLFDIKGGDTAQMEHTRDAIQKMYPDIHIDISTSLKEPKIAEYDIVQLFNLDWICETYVQMQWAKRHNKKVVVSAIHHSESEVSLYESKYRFDLRRIYNALITKQSMRDEWKNIYRSFFDHRKIFPTLVQVTKGIRNSQRSVLGLADAVLVQTEIEKDDIQKDFNVSLNNAFKVVNGVNVDLFQKTNPDDFSEMLKEKYKFDNKGKLMILNVGRIEPRKNQLSLIKAFKNLQKKHLLENAYLVFIGAYSKYSPEYTYLFDENIKGSKNIFYFKPQPQAMVASAMRNPGIYVHPSWFETTGLVALEAAVAGRRVVACGERFKEYMKDEAFYCEPDKVYTIENAIIKSLEAGDIKPDFIDKIRGQYSWEETARQTVDVYFRINQDEPHSK